MKAFLNWGIPLGIVFCLSLVLAAVEDHYGLMPAVIVCGAFLLGMVIMEIGQRRRK